MNYSKLIASLEAKQVRQAEALKITQDHIAALKVLENQQNALTASTSKK